MHTIYMKELIYHILENIPSEMISYIDETLGREWVEDPEKLLFSILTLLGIIIIKKTKKGKLVAYMRPKLLFGKLFVSSYRYALYLYYKKKISQMFRLKYSYKILNPLIKKIVDEKMKELFGENERGALSERSFRTALIFLAYLLDRKLL